MGPGDYENLSTPFGQQGLKYTIGTKKDYKTGDTTPPIGYYDTVKSLNMTLPNTQSYTIRGGRDDSVSQGRSQRNISPGPC